MRMGDITHGLLTLKFYSSSSRPKKALAIQLLCLELHI